MAEGNVKAPRSCKGEGRKLQGQSTQCKTWSQIIQLGSRDAGNWTVSDQKSPEACTTSLRGHTHSSAAHQAREVSGGASTSGSGCLVAAATGRLLGYAQICNNLVEDSAEWQIGAQKNRDHGGVEGMARPWPGLRAKALEVIAPILFVRGWSSRCADRR